MSQLSPCSLKENYDPAENQIQSRNQQNEPFIVKLQPVLSTSNTPTPLKLPPMNSYHQVATSLDYESSFKNKRKKRICHKSQTAWRTNLSVIERHKKLGGGALDKLKVEVQAYAVDHTYKETARRFGVHHSTVSGWIKQSDAKRKKQMDSCKAIPNVCGTGQDFQNNPLLNASQVQSHRNLDEKSLSPAQCNCQQENANNTQICQNGIYEYKVLNTSVTSKSDKFIKIAPCNQPSSISSTCFVESR